MLTHPWAEAGRANMTNAAASISGPIVHFRNAIVFLTSFSSRSDLTILRETVALRR